MITRANVLRFGLSAGLALTGTMGQAAGADPAAKEKLLAVIVKHGCKVTENNNEAILAEAGLQEAQAKSIVEALFAKGEAVTEGGDMVLKTEGCN